MSDNSPLPSDPQLTKNIIHDVFKDSGFLDRHGPKPLNPQEEVLMRAAQVTDEVWNLMQDILRAANDKGQPYNPASAFATAFKFTRDKFSHWSKDDLEFLATVVHAEFILTKCDTLAEQLL